MEKAERFQSRASGGVKQRHGCLTERDKKHEHPAIEPVFLFSVAREYGNANASALPPATGAGSNYPGTRFVGRGHTLYQFPKKLTHFLCDIDSHIRQYEIRARIYPIEPHADRPFARFPAFSGPAWANMCLSQKIRYGTVRNTTCCGREVVSSLDSYKIQASVKKRRNILTSKCRTPIFTTWADGMRKNTETPQMKH